MIRRAAGFGAVLLVLAACATKDPDSPGTTVGTYNVTGTLKSTSCGGTTPNPWTFSAKLNYDGSTIYWIENDYPDNGTLSATGTLTVNASMTEDVRDATSTQAECDITRSDAVSILLSDSTDTAVTDITKTASFLGTLSYTFSAASGSDCSDQLTAAGGGYDALPCTVSYAISGQLGSSSN